MDRSGGDALPVGHGDVLRAAPLGVRPQDPASLAGEIERRRLAEAEGPHVGLLLVGPDGLGHKDRADVRGLREDLVDGEGLGGVHLGVMQPYVPVLLSEGHEEAGLGGDFFLVEGCGDGDDLGHRAGLVGVHRRIVSCPHADYIGLRVTAHRGHGEDLAGSRVHHDRRCTSRPELVHLRHQRLLGLVLQRKVDREADVIAGHRCDEGLAARRDGPALGSLDLAQLPVDTGQEPVVLLLQTCAAVTVDVCQPDHATADLRVGEITTRLVDAADARELEVLDHESRLCLYLTRNIHKARTRHRELSEQGLLTLCAEPEHPCEGHHGPPRVDDGPWIRVDRL